MRNRDVTRKLRQSYFINNSAFEIIMRWIHHISKLETRKSQQQSHLQTGYNS